LQDVLQILKGLHVVLMNFARNIYASRPLNASEHFEEATPIAFGVEDSTHLIATRLINFAV
jgi:hypothetical protein